MVQEEKQSPVQQNSSPLNTLEQMGKAIKFIGTFMSWARAMNPSTANEPDFGRSNDNTAQGLIKESPVESGELLEVVN